MSTYRVKTGHDEDLVDLVDVDPQPTSTGIQVTRRSYGGDGTVRTVGLYVELVFNILPTTADYQAVLTQFGLSGSLTADVTVYVRDGTFTWIRKNGKAVQPDPGRDVVWTNYFPRRINILIKNLEDPT